MRGVISLLPHTPPWHGAYLITGTTLPLSLPLPFDVWNEDATWNFNYVKVFWFMMCSVVVGRWRWRRRQHGPLKCWYLTTTLHRVTTQKTSTWTFSAVKTSNLASSGINVKINGMDYLKQRIRYSTESVIPDVFAWTWQKLEYQWDVCLNE